MFMLFLVACLSFVMIAGAVSAVSLAAGMISSKKTGAVYAHVTTAEEEKVLKV